MPDKPIIFVSHAAVDSEIANLFKCDVESAFLGMCSLFVSSNLDSISSGSEWMTVIKQNLSEAVISIGLLSPAALNRPWVYTEFGAGWIREIPTISLCHSGLQKDQLPVPLSHFQALNLTDSLHLEHLYKKISDAVGCAPPQRDFSKDVESYLKITEVNRKKRLITQWVKNISTWNNNFCQLEKKDEIEILIPSDADFVFRQVIPVFHDAGYLVIQSKGMAMGTSVGMQASVWTVSKGRNYSNLASIIPAERIVAEV